MNQIRRPDGIERRHIHAHRRRHAWPTGLLLFALVPLLAAFGVFGTRDTVTASSAGVDLSLQAPTRIRSGEFFEMIFTVRTQREIRDAVLAIPPAVWHEITINTMIPQPTEEGFENGAFAFHFGALPPGSRLVVKVDGQVNPTYPPGNNEGTVELVDGAATLASVDYSLTVLP